MLPVYFLKTIVNRLQDFIIPLVARDSLYPDDIPAEVLKSFIIIVIIIMCWNADLLFIDEGF